jgi:nucleoside-diphosphate-sugar epimerase
VPGELERAAEGVDALIDVVPYTPADGRQLAALAAGVESIVAISSAAVYGLGGERGPLPVPVPESHPTVPAGDGGYAARKRAVEELLLADGAGATVIRAGAVYGPMTRHSREWYFVKRALDRRPAVVLARRGESRFHTVSAENLAELIALAAETPGSRVLNAGDPRPPTVLEIARAVAETMGHTWEEVLLSGPEHGTLGDHPWNV